MKRVIVCFVLLFSTGLLSAHSVKTEGDKYIVSHEWDFEGQKWSCKIPVKKDLYNYYKNEREHIGFNFPAYALSEYDRKFVKGLISSFRKSGNKVSMSDFEVVKNVVCFVQSLQYVTDKKSTGLDDYVRFPVETIVDGIGDCEDFAILVASILHEMNYSVVLLQLPGHLAVAVASEDFVTGTYYKYNGKKYYYLETTNPGWDIGDIPNDYKKISAEVLPLVSKPVLFISSTNYSVTYTSDKAGFDVKCKFTNYGPLSTKETFVYVETVFNGEIIANNIKYIKDVKEGETKEIVVHLDSPNKNVFELNIVVGGKNCKRVSNHFDINL